MGTLHVLRSEPDQQLWELIRAVTPGEARTIALYGELTDYDDLLAKIFSHHDVISWW